MSIATDTPHDAALAVDAHGLVKQFKGLRAVDGIDLQVQAGEVYGFLGPNGAGKTTTVRMLVTLLRAAVARKEPGVNVLLYGPPGTGKTYTAARLLALLYATQGAAPLRIGLAAPTGKAAARLKQAIDTAIDDLQARLSDALPLQALAAQIGPARTLHALLGARRGRGRRDR